MHIHSLQRSSIYCCCEKNVSFVCWFAVAALPLSPIAVGGREKGKEERKKNYLATCCYPIQEGEYCSILREVG
uniref:Uncharacterized protein n=1 Tax=Octopus bimaculoides TaxID=37653 RepID=A0A0L8GC32_OCTBM